MFGRIQLSLMVVLLHLVLDSLALEAYQDPTKKSTSSTGRQPRANSNVDINTATYITKEGKPVTIANLGGDEQYQALVADSMDHEGIKIQKQGKWYIRDGESLVPSSPDPPKNPQAEAIIAAALRGIRKEVSRHMPGASIDVTSISIPQHFNESMYSAVADAALELERGIKVPWQIRRYYNAVRLAYHLNSCEGFGMDASTCDVEDGPHLVFFIDYNHDYLEVCVADVGEFIFSDVTKNTFRDIGARKLAISSEQVCAAIKTRLVSTRARTDVKSQEIESYWDAIRSELRAFIRHYFEAPDRNADVNNIRAIVLAGDAPAEAFQNIRDVVVGILPGQADKIRDTVDPSRVGAVGAAEWAKLQALNPELVKEIISHASSDTRARDEL